MSKVKFFLLTFVLTSLVNSYFAKSVYSPQQRMSGFFSPSTEETLPSNVYKESNFDSSEAAYVPDNLESSPDARTPLFLHYNPLQMSEDGTYLLGQNEGREEDGHMENENENDIYVEEGLETPDKRDGHHQSSDLQQMRNRNGNRRQQAAKWDIGFGKRANDNFSVDKFSLLLNSLSRKRNTARSGPRKVTFGRKQHWDIQYGK